jgi:hypothetical protein
MRGVANAGRCADPKPLRSSTTQVQIRVCLLSQSVVSSCTVAIHAARVMDGEPREGLQLETEAVLIDIIPGSAS